MRINYATDILGNEKDKTNLYNDLVFTKIGIKDYNFFFKRSNIIIINYFMINSTFNTNKG